MNLMIAMIVAYIPFFIGVIQLAREENNKSERDQLHHKRVRWTDTEN